jgi:aspartate-semialdehyde dehydrogenase
VEFEKAINLGDIRSLLSKSPGIVVVDDPSNQQYPMPMDAHDNDDVLVGRLRIDDTQPNTLNMWIVSDNLRKGAATNAIQIAEYLNEKGLLGKKTSEKLASVV